jgi:LacI family transcriptional regulator
MITVKDVARQAKVSPGTVSNALTGKRPVSAATRDRILQAIEDLGYQPNILARSLVNRRSETLAVVASQLEYYGPAHTVVGIEQEANGLGYSLLLTLLHRPDTADASAALSALASRRVDGIIWAVPEIGDNRAWISAERLASLPPIIFLSMGSRPGLPVVAVDNRAGAALAARHLVGQDRRVPGIITGPLCWWEARERCAGFTETLAAAGISLPNDLQVEGDWTAASGEVGLRRLLAYQPNIDAVFASNDQMALGALRAAHALGRRVPADLAVVGFDNTPESAYYWPALTTVFQQPDEVGRLAVRELHRVVEARREGRESGDLAAMLLPPQLIIRESSVSIQA